MRMFRGRREEPVQAFALRLEVAQPTTQPTERTPVSADKLTYSKLHPGSPLELGARMVSYFLKLEAEELGVETLQPSEQEWRQRVDDGTYKAVLAIDGGRNYGMALSERRDDGSYNLTHWYVIEKERGRGIGRLMLEAIEVATPPRDAAEAVYADSVLKAGMNTVEATQV